MNDKMQKITELFEAHPDWTATVHENPNNDGRDQLTLQYKDYSSSRDLICLSEYKNERDVWVLSINDDYYGPAAHEVQRSFDEVLQDEYAIYAYLWLSEANQHLTYGHHSHKFHDEFGPAKWSKLYYQWAN